MNKNEIKKTKNENCEIELNQLNSFHWQIILNRPNKLNAITLSMYKQLIEIFNQAKLDKDLIVLSILGQGKYFSSGTDLTNPMKFLNNSTNEINIEESINLGEQILKEFIETLIDFPKILIAFINGPAIGISVSMLSLFDGVYASSQATFSLPFTRTGQSAECCSSYQFPLLMGSIHAKELLLFNRELTAEQAQQRGIVTRVIEEKYFSQEISLIIDEILCLPKETLIRNKILIQKWNKTILHQVNEEELKILKQSWTHEEFLQSINRFFMKKTKSKL